MDSEKELSLKKGEETRVFHLSVMTQGIAVVWRINDCSGAWRREVASKTKLEGLEVDAHQRHCASGGTVRWERCLRKRLCRGLKWGVAKCKEDGRGVTKVTWMEKSAWAGTHGRVILLAAK